MRLRARYGATCHAGCSQLIAVEACHCGLALQGTTAIKSIPGHAKGPQAIQVDGHVAYTGVRGMRLTEKRDPATGDVSRMLLTGARSR